MAQKSSSPPKEAPEALSNLQRPRNPRQRRAEFSAEPPAQRPSLCLTSPSTGFFAGVGGCSLKTSEMGEANGIFLALPPRSLWELALPFAEGSWESWVLSLGEPCPRPELVSAQSSLRSLPTPSPLYCQGPGRSWETPVPAGGKPGSQG